MRSEIVKTIIKSLGALNVPVYEWRVTPFDIGDLPAIVVRDTEDRIDSAKDGFSSEHELKIEVLFFVAKSDLTIDELRAKTQEILSALGEAEKSINGFLALDGVDLDIDHEDEIVGRALIETTAKYYTEKWSL